MVIQGFYICAFIYAAGPSACQFKYRSIMWITWCTNDLSWVVSGCFDLSSSPRGSTRSVCGNPSRSIKHIIIWFVATSVSWCLRCSLSVLSRSEKRVHSHGLAPLCCISRTISILIVASEYILMSKRKRKDVPLCHIPYDFSIDTAFLTIFCQLNIALPAFPFPFYFTCIQFQSIIWAIIF